MSERRMFEIKCTECGNTAMVPFKPSANKPVYCSTCFSKHVLKQRETVSTDLSFNPKQAWARRGDSWHGRKEARPANIFQEY